MILGYVREADQQVLSLGEDRSGVDLGGMGGVAGRIGSGEKMVVDAAMPVAAMPAASPFVSTTVSTLSR